MGRIALDPTLDPIRVVQALRPLGSTFLLESRVDRHQLGRYSIVGTQPTGRVRIRNDQAHVDGSLPAPKPSESATTYLERLQSERRTAAEPDDPPFTSGLVGNLNWNAVHLLEPTYPKGDAGQLDDYPDAIVWDREATTLTYHYDGQPRQAILERIQAIEPTQLGSLPKATLGPWSEDLNDAAFERAVHAAKQEIARGECFQIVLSRAREADLHGDPLAIYQALRQDNPVPYLFYLYDANEDTHLFGASPEMLVRVRGGVAQSFPIAGTRRFRTPAEADAMAAELLADPKERAEHTMLVDLARNDLYRSCDARTVRVQEFLQPRTYRDVVHLVSRVEGRLKPTVSALRALLHAFPAGTVSGAPKLRAIRHIERLEPTPRDWYAGCIVYWSRTGDLDSALTIRSACVRGHRIQLRAGAGVVYDSEPRLEALETRNKLRSIEAAIERTTQRGTA